MSKNIAVILSGCGVFDGAEIHESVCSLLAIDQAGASYQCFAPDIEQYHVINHINGEEMDESRNVLTEAARIARGQILPLDEFDADSFDAILLPGGFGAAKNLSSFAFDGSEASVNDEVKLALQAMRRADKPIGALCISPAILAKVFGEVELTIGNDAPTISELESCGAKHKEAGHGEIVVDEAHKIVTTPCYMLDASIAQIFVGANNAVKSLLSMC